MDDRHLDEAIDRAVREMMGVEPRPGMRNRVLGRLTRSERVGIPWLRLAAAGALATLLFMLTLPDRQPRPAPGKVVPEAPTSTPPAVVATAPPAPADATKPAVAPPAGASRTDDRRVQAAMFEPSAPFETIVDIAPLVPIEPIQLAELTAKAIVSTEIAVAPLRAVVPITIDRIEVEPLPPPR